MRSHKNHNFEFIMDEQQAILIKTVRPELVEGSRDIVRG